MPLTLYLVIDWLHKWTKLGCVFNMETSCGLNSLSVLWKVFPIPCCNNLQEDQLIMKSQCCLLLSSRNSDPGQRPLSSWTITQHSEWKIQGTWIMPQEEGSVCVRRLTNSHRPACLSVVAGLQQEANYFRKLLFCSKGHLLTAAHYIPGSNYNGYLVSFACNCQPIVK